MISIFIGIVFVLMAVLGGLMSSNRTWQRIAFGILGAIGITLIVFQGLEQTKEEGKLQKEIKTLRQELKDEDHRHQLELEKNRRLSILNKCRQKWISSHDSISPGMAAGTEMPPKDWINNCLKEMGENWIYKGE